MDLNTHKRRKTTLYFKKLFIMVKVYFYDHPITKKKFTWANFVFPEDSLIAWEPKASLNTQMLQNWRQERNLFSSQFCWSKWRNLTFNGVTVNYLYGQAALNVQVSERISSLEDQQVSKPEAIQAGNSKQE